ncbi:hypothetical protein RSOLAG1IB_09495 [Rhizoctonia solani AG-1 IB]|uniref:Uncharacterized protein n=1 Tax=Thanatephorus cucumeris (strain AG1-IB / isolate 7/3/14) TaxID=1108050 RepID=A0A0B7FQJ6_THACB|nr:hypothetical protein RSOLAG1IB_09495 [Rhizoctonia solani AG-1 IB]
MCQQRWVIGINMSGIGLNVVDKSSRIISRAHRLDADLKRAASFAHLNRQRGFAMEPAEAAKLILDRIGREVACHTLLFVFTLWGSPIYTISLRCLRASLAPALPSSGPSRLQLACTYSHPTPRPEAK